MFLEAVGKLSGLTGRAFVKEAETVVSDDRNDTGDDKSRGECLKMTDNAGSCALVVTLMAQRLVRTTCSHNSFCTRIVQEGHGSHMDWKT